MTFIDPADVHYRLALKEGKAVAACVQDFDYPDYVFATSSRYGGLKEANEAATQYNMIRAVQKAAENGTLADLEALMTGGEFEYAMEETSVATGNKRIAGLWTPNLEGVRHSIKKHREYEQVSVDYGGSVRTTYAIAKRPKPEAYTIMEEV